MLKTITIAAYNRPEHLAMLLDSLYSQLLPLSNYELYIRVDAGGDQFNEVMQVASKTDFIKSRLFSSSENEGIISNTYWLMHHVFDTLKSDFNVYLEDDLILSPDAFNLVEWYIENYSEILTHVHDIGAFCLCELGGGTNPERLFLSRAMVGWGFLMSAWQWKQYGEPSWRDSVGLWGKEMMWDSSLANYIRKSRKTAYNVFPELSRITNSGETGVHCTPTGYKKLMMGHTYNTSRELYSFYLEDLHD